MATTTQLKAAAAVLISVTEAIREAGELPSGHLYATLMSLGYDMEAFQKIVTMIVNTGLVEKRGDLLRWIGPEIKAA